MEHDLHRMSGLQKLAARVAAEKVWAAEHQEIALAWDEALEEAYLRGLAGCGWRTQEPVAEYLKACGVGSLETGVVVKGLEPRESRVVTKEWLAGTKLMLVLHGGPGSGKTVAACEALLDPRYRRAGRFITAYQLSRESYYERDFHLANEKAGLLVVDDIGQEQLAGPFLATLDGLLSERIRWERRTILTANLSMEDFQNRFAPKGSRLASRLAGYAVAKGTGSEDWRLEP